METIAGTKNPIIKTLKENDIVMVECPSSEKSFKQICRIYNLKYQQADEKLNFDWLEFDAEVMYVNFRVHPTLNRCIGNCLAITEIIPKELVETYARQYEMWKPDLFPLSDAEFKAKRYFRNYVI